jgi:hypothetical protein
MQQQSSDVIRTLLCASRNQLILCVCKYGMTVAECLSYAVRKLALRSAQASLSGGDAMFRSHYSGETVNRSRTALGAFGFAHDSASRSSAAQAQDSRPLWQRMDDEEDQVLIRQRRWMQSYRVMALVVFGTLFFSWFIGQ